MQAASSADAILAYNCSDVIHVTGVRIHDVAVGIHGGVRIHDAAVGIHGTTGKNS